MPSPPVRAPNRTTWLPGPSALASLMPSAAHDADAQRVDQRVADVAVVEVRPRRRCWAGRGSCRTRRRRRRRRAARARCPARVERAEAQAVHHRDRPRAHGQDVADDAADAGRRALVRLDVGRMVVRLDLERDRPAVADVDDTGVLAHADEQRVGPAAPSRRTAAGGPSTTCRSSARSTSPSRWRARSWSGRRPRISRIAGVLVRGQAEFLVRLGLLGGLLRRCSTVSSHAAPSTRAAERPGRSRGRRCRGR